MIPKPGLPTIAVDPTSSTCRKCGGRLVPASSGWYRCVNADPANIDHREHAHVMATFPLPAAPRPPSGVRPARLWLEDRIRELLRAIAARLDSNQAVPVEWGDELGGRIYEHTAEIEKAKEAN